jgi:adenylate cyclase
MNAERATLFLLDDFTGELWSMLAEGMTSREIRISRDKGVAGWVVNNRKTVNIEDAYADSRFDPAMDKITGFTTRSILCGPLMNLKGELVGALQVINKHGGSFDRADESFFSAFAYQTSIAVENLQLYKRLIKDHEKMAILFDVATHVARTLDLDTLFVDIVTKITEILQVERSSLFLVDRDKGELWSKVAQKSELTGIRFPLSQGLAGYVAETGETLNIRNAYEDPRFLAAVDEKTGFSTRSVLCAPIVNRTGNVIGVVQAMNKKGADFDKEDEDLIRALCSHMAVALENAQLFEKTVEMKNYLASVQESISNAIVTLDADSRVVTVNHAARILLKGPVALEGAFLHDILGNSNESLNRDIRRIHETGKAMVSYDTELLLPSGRQHTVNANAVPLVDASGEKKGVVLVLDDITQEKRMKSTLVRYMAKDIVERILEDPSQQTLGGKRGKATILFSDIRGYTGITESLSAEETVAFLNEYFSLMVNVIFENDGVLDKYMGDGIMSVFGAPFTRDDDAVRAVRTALAMQEKLASFNRSRCEKEKPPIHIGIGISTGEVISGNIGSERRMEYTVIGDGVNVASRIEKLTKHYGAGILISDSTARDLDGLFTIRSVDVVRIRGKKRPVEIFQVLGGKGMELSWGQRCFSEGMARYRNKNFEDARDFFLKGADDDPLCRIFLDRCAQLLTTDTQSWDGIWVSPF